MVSITIFSFERWQMHSLSLKNNKTFVLKVKTSSCDDCNIFRKDIKIDRFMICPPLKASRLLPLMNHKPSASVLCFYSSDVTGSWSRLSIFLLVYNKVYKDLRFRQQGLYSHYFKSCQISIWLVVSLLQHLRVTILHSVLCNDL